MQCLEQRIREEPVAEPPVLPRRFVRCGGGQDERPSTNGSPNPTVDGRGLIHGHADRLAGPATMFSRRRSVGPRVGSSIPEGIVERFVGLVAAAAPRIAGHRVISWLCKCEFVLVLESGSVFVGYRAVQGVVDGDMFGVEVDCLDGYR